MDKKYLLVRARTTRLEDAVNRLLDEYEPLGSPFVLPERGEEQYTNGAYLCQAMVKRKSATIIKGPIINIDGREATNAEISEVTQKVLAEMQRYLEDEMGVKRYEPAH